MENVNEAIKLIAQAKELITELKCCEDWRENEKLFYCQKYLDEAIDKLAPK
jgi:hypothetical protein